MKEAALIINIHSGMGKKHDNIDKYLDIFKKYGYHVTLHVTKYRYHAMEIVESLDENVSLVLSVGGDGTFNEVVTGNFHRAKPLLLSHIPYGTTNDIGAMFSMGKNLEKNLIAILSGQKRKIDICTINGQPFVYVAGFGKFMNVPYETPRKLKKKIGYLAYLIEGVKDFFHSNTHLYDLTYEVDGEAFHGLYSFALISNANRVAGIKNFYKGVHLDDRKFEVLFCNLSSKKDIIRSLFGLKISDVTKIPGFYFYKTDHLKVTFHEKLRKPWCLDGEEFVEKGTVYEISVVPGLEMLLPKKISKELFIHE